MQNERFRLLRPLTVVQAACNLPKPEIVTLPPGATVSIAGASPLPGFILVLCQDVEYNAFERDLRDRTRASACYVAGEYSRRAAS